MTRYIAFIIIGLFMSACYDFSLEDPEDTGGTDGNNGTSGASGIDNAGEGGTGSVKGVGSVPRTQPEADASPDAAKEVGCPEDTPVDCGSYCCPSQYPKCGGCGFDCCTEETVGSGGDGGTGGDNGTGGIGPTGGDNGTGGIGPTGGSGGSGGDGGSDGGGVISEPDASGAIVGPDPIPSEGCGADSPLSGNFTVDVQGTTREYVVQVPTDYNSNKPYKLVFAWHGLGGTAAMTAVDWFGLGAYANNSAIFIAGQAQGQGTNASWVIHPDESDMDYARAMLEWAKTNYCIDTSRVFSIGVSNGGMMSNIVGCELGELFRAIAVIAGGGPQGYATTPCKGQVAVWITHGNQDINVTFDYGERSRDYWIGANHCRSETVPAPPDPCLEYQGCDDGFPVQFCEHDGGHTVPSFTGEAAWNFFARL